MESPIFPWKDIHNIWIWKPRTWDCIARLTENFSYVLNMKWAFLVSPIQRAALGLHGAYQCTWTQGWLHLSVGNFPSMSNFSLSLIQLEMVIVIKRSFHLIDLFPAQGDLFSLKIISPSANNLVVDHDNCSALWWKWQFGCNGCYRSYIQIKYNRKYYIKLSSPLFSLF